MDEKLDELIHKKKYLNSPESQEFLHKLHNDLIKGNEELRKRIEEWKKEDEANRNN
jgi:hypothetical protein